MVVAIAAGATALSVGSSLYSASQQSDAASDAAAMQQESADQAVALQREIYQQQRQDLAPWRQAGQRGLRRLQQLAQQGPPARGPWRGAAQFRFQPPTAADLRRDPGYQFRLTQGSLALERSAAARGGLLSGGFARDLTDYAQGMASQEYGNVYRRELGENQLGYERALQQYTTNYNTGLGTWQARMAPWQALAMGGQGATTQSGQLGANYASSVGSILGANANAQGAAGMAGANAWGNFGVDAAGSLSGLAGVYARRQNNPAGTMLPTQTRWGDVNPYGQSIYNVYS